MRVLGRVRVVGRTLRGPTVGSAVGCYGVPVPEQVPGAAEGGKGTIIVGAIWPSGEGSGAFSSVT